MADLLSNQPTSSNFEARTNLQTLLLAQKTELIGELTRAMANQFNNTMMAITSYAELEMKKARPSERRNLEQLMGNAARATALVQKLLILSRKHTPTPQPLNLNSVLKGISNLLEQLAGEHVSVALSLDPDITSVSADPAEIEQAILSLAICARDALGKGGTLTIATKLVELTKKDIGEADQPGRYVMLSINDTGSGHSAEETAVELPGSLDQDSRVNLSFAAVRGIIKNSNGLIRFRSEREAGSSFKMYLPALKQSAPAEGGRIAPRSVPIARTVLVVEDDDAILVPASEFLKMEGFKVLQARTGAEAIHVVTQNRATLDVLITDIVMPRMTGREVAEKLLELHPGLKVLFMSGDDGAADLLHTGRGQNALLRKPFRLNTLKDKIHELLGE